jgi:hypothetical protein
MSYFKVVTPTLAAASLMIDGNAESVRSAGSSASSAAGQQGAFASEQIAGAFAAMCVRAQHATEELEGTMRELSRNVAAAAVGYLVTDRGIVPIRDMPGFKP